MHRLEYIHAIAGSIALILPALLAGNASAEFFAPEVFGRAPQHVTTTEPAPRYNLHNARLQPEPENTELTSSKAASIRPLDQPAGKRAAVRPAATATAALLSGQPHSTSHDA